MPKPNKTMLDKLVDVFKSGSQRKPEIIQQGPGRDFLSVTISERPDVKGRLMTAYNPDDRDVLSRAITPTRQKYQKGLEDIHLTQEQPHIYDQGQAEMANEDLQNDFEDAWSEAWDAYMDDAAPGEGGSQFVPAPELEYGLVDSDFIFEPDPRNLKDYWPTDYYSPAEFESEREYFDKKWTNAQNAIDYMRTPEYRMQLQRQSPRYRRYQEAMQRRDINRRAGRVNAAIMNLARQGYSLPEIREILRRQGR